MGDEGGHRAFITAPFFAKSPVSRGQFVRIAPPPPPGKVSMKNTRAAGMMTGGRQKVGSSQGHVEPYSLLENVLMRHLGSKPAHAIPVDDGVFAVISRGEGGVGGAITVCMVHSEGDADCGKPTTMPEGCWKGRGGHGAVVLLCDEDVGGKGGGGGYAIYGKVIGGSKQVVIAQDRVPLSSGGDAALLSRSSFLVVSGDGEQGSACSVSNQTTVVCGAPASIFGSGGGTAGVRVAAAGRGDVVVAGLSNSGALSVAVVKVTPDSKGEGGGGHVITLLPQGVPGVGGAVRLFDVAGLGPSRVAVSWVSKDYIHAVLAVGEGEWGSMSWSAAASRPLIGGAQSLRVASAGTPDLFGLVYMCEKGKPHALGGFFAPRRGGGGGGMG